MEGAIFPMNFDELNLAPAILKAVLEQGYETPTAIQAQAIPLVLAGAEVLHDFSLALLGGVMFGTYSSIFVASPLLLLWPGSAGGLLKRR